MSGIIVSYSGRPIPLIAFLSRGPHRIAPESPAARIGRLPKRCAFGSRQKVRPSPLNRALIPSTGCHAFWKADAHWSQKVSPTCAPLPVPEPLLFGTAPEKRAYRQRGKALEPPQHHFGTTAPRSAPDGAPAGNPCRLTDITARSQQPPDSDAAGERRRGTSCDAGSKARRRTEEYFRSLQITQEPD
jgi:hypothetical protein